MDIRGKNQGAAGDVDIDTQNNYFGGNSQALPNSIPSPQGFVGRVDYLGDLHKDYENGTRCFVLHGTGGVGKTALALQFAEEIAGNYDAKILVELNGMSDKPLSAQEAMFDIVRQFEPEISVDLSPEQVKELYISKVQNQKTLIVLDNARDIESVESLKDAKACFITTSRDAFMLTGGKRKQVLQMLPGDARKLLFEIAGEARFDGQADALAELAGYLPMALKPLASILAEDDLETAANLTARYKDKQKLLKERVPDYKLTVETSFELSYERLSDELKEYWRRLSVFPADFDEKAIAAVLDISAEKAEETQKQLRKFSLLEVTAETRRFNLHDLIREFTNAKLKDDERFQSQFLFAKYYASILLVAQDMKDENQKIDYANALKIIDTDWSNITAGQKWTAQIIETIGDAKLSKSQHQIADFCTDYSGYARNFVRLRLHPRENIKWLESGLKAARNICSGQREGRNLGNLGIAYDALGEYRKAIDYYEQSLTILRKISDRLGEGSCLGNLGLAYANLGDYHKAVGCHEQALAISRKFNNRLGEGNCLGGLGLAHINLGEYHKAVDYQEQALAISREIGDRPGEGISLSNLGLAYFRLGNYQKAIDYYEQSLTISQEIGSRSGEGVSLSNLGTAYNCLGEREKACSFWKEALAIFEAIESPNANIVRQLITENGC